MSIKIKRFILASLSAACAICFAFTAMTKNEVRAERVTTGEKVTLYQLAPENQSLMQSYVIKTANGKLVVIDGGIDGAGKDSPAYLTSALRAIAGVGEGEYFEVEAWFLSHAHSDHIRELSKMLGSGNYDAQSNFKINNFYFDFPSDFSAYPASDYSEEDLNALKAALQNYAEVNAIETDSYYDTLNSAVINSAAIESGLTIDIDGVYFDILQTWHPTADGQINDNSTVIKMRVGENYSVMFLNDIAVASGNRLVETYSDNPEILKADVVQMAHHGQSGADKNVYDAIGAPVHLWPTPLWVWNNPAYPIDQVREWVGATAEADNNNLVACLYENYPADPTKVSDWAGVIEGMSMQLPYLPYDFMMNEGAGVRLSEGSDGIRFSATLSSYDPQAEYGFVIVPTRYITDNNITSDYVQRLTEIYGADGIIKLNSLPYQTGAFYRINGSIANIRYENINLEYTGIAYEYKNGVYTYAEYETLESISRSVPLVAAKALNEYHYYGNPEGYTAENVSVLESFINKSVNAKNGATEDAQPQVVFGFDNQSVEIILGQSETLSISSNLPDAGIIWESDNPDSVTVKDGTVTAIGQGQSTISAKCAGYSASVTVKVAEIPLEDGYLAQFDSAAYESLVTKSTYPDEVRQAESIDAEWLSEYAGESNVLKVTSVNNNVFGSTGIGDISLILPKACESGLTLKVMVGSETTATTVRFLIPGTQNGLGAPETDLKTGVTENPEGWILRYLDYNGVGVKDRIEIMLQDGAAGGVNVLYFAFVMEGNKVSDLENAEAIKEEAATLEEGYLADFDAEVYKNLVSLGTAQGAHSLQTALHESFMGETNVLEASFNSGGYISSDSTSYGAFPVVHLILPKEYTNGYTIKYMIHGYDFNEAGDFSFCESGTITPVKTYRKGGIENDVWNTDYVSGAGNTVSIRCYSHRGSTELKIYFAFVKDGDKTADEGLLQALENEAATLEEGYLADFDNAVYEDFVMPSPYNPDYRPESLSAEYLSEYGGENDVLKITSVNNSYGGCFSDFVVKLPKTINESEGFTIRYMIESTGSDMCVLLSTNANHQGLKTLYDGGENQTGEWKSVYITNPYAYVMESLNELFFTFWGNAGAENVIYISFVAEGDATQW